MQDLQNVLPVLILVLTDINERLIEFGGSQQQENATNFESKIVRLCWGTYQCSSTSKLRQNKHMQFQKFCF